MSFRPLRSLARVVAAVSATATVTGLMAAPAQADSAVSPVNGSVVVQGKGYGHGIGMSQYGAYGRARAGQSKASILSFYYPGTTTATQSASDQMRVWISGDNDGSLEFAPAPGLRLRSANGSATWAFPQSPDVKAWRISRSGSVRVLDFKHTSGAWIRFSPTMANTTDWYVDNPSTGYVTVKRPNGTSTDFRGQMVLRFWGTGARTINVVPTEQYLQSVVPSEMPASWSAAAVQAQSVAARTYAVRYKKSLTNGVYDICDSTSCQVYKGLATRSTSGTRTVHEYTASTSAVNATRGQVLKYGTAYANTMFSSSNGGAMVSGGFAYLPRKLDSYDGAVTSQAWSKTVSASTIQAKYPTIGTLTRVQVIKRDGLGSYGGRVTSITLTGTKGSVTVSGDHFRIRTGLRSTLFVVKSTA